MTMKLLLGASITILITKMSTQIFSYNLRNTNILWSVYVYIKYVFHKQSYTICRIQFNIYDSKDVS